MHHPACHKIGRLSFRAQSRAFCGNGGEESASALPLRRYTIYVIALVDAVGKSVSQEGAARARRQVLVNRLTAQARTKTAAPASSHPTRCPFPAPNKVLLHRSLADRALEQRESAPVVRSSTIIKMVLTLSRTSIDKVISMAYNFRTSWRLTFTLAHLLISKAHLPGSPQEVLPGSPPPNAYDCPRPQSCSLATFRFCRRFAVPI
jgi:hypothetical protein